GMALRPTATKVKEALFNVLRDQVKGARVVDFFAGTGNVGIEALSRGADHVVFVENHAPSVRLLRNNLTACGLHSKAKIYTMDAFTFLKKIKRRLAAGGPSSGSASDGPGRGGIGGHFPLYPHGPPHTINILFADPPYHGPLAERFLRHLGKSDMIAERTLVVIEHFHKLPLPERAGCLGLVKRYRYGDTLLSVYRYSVQVSLGEVLDKTERT
ncbi:MAG: RsmD family RNA methyltransferase, partial [Nitrospira sp.]|nr:RsmD family RNA methyltransferase [Nitrospira sp.]